MKKKSPDMEENKRGTDVLTYLFVCEGGGANFASFNIFFFHFHCLGARLCLFEWPNK